MKKIISILTIIAILFACTFILTGCEKEKGGDNQPAGGTTETSKVELDTAEITYTYPWETQIWKNYKVKVGYPKNDNWVVQDNSSDTDELVLKDETRKLEITMKVDQVSESTWKQNSEQRKESMNGKDNKWGNYEGFYYTIAQNTYNGWIFLGNPTSIEDGKTGTHVNKLEFQLQSKGGSETTLEELIKIMDEDILPNLSWEEID